jgi:alkylation response protein AidB-like acyl-CoA dehydrogenase
VTISFALDPEIRALARRVHAFVRDDVVPAEGEAPHAGGRTPESTAVAKVFVAEAVNRVVDRAMQLCGSLGVSEDRPLGRFPREVRPFRIYDGPSEVHRWSLARRRVKAGAGEALPGWR